VRICTLLQLAFVLLSPVTAFANYDLQMVHTLLGGRPFEGFYGEMIKDEIGPVREVRFSYDGRNARLLRAGQEPLELPERYLFATQIGRHPDGPWKVFILRWSLPDNVMFELVFRPDPALEYEAEVQMNGLVKSLPRVLLSFINKANGEVLAQGGLASEDQPEILAQMRGAFKKLNIGYLSFNEVQRRECEKALSKTLIRTKR